MGSSVEEMLASAVEALEAEVARVVATMMAEETVVEAWAAVGMEAWVEAAPVVMEEAWAAPRVEVTRAALAVS